MFMKQVINCIWKHPAAALVYLTCDLLGQEDILAQVSQTFGSKIYVDKAANPECFQALTMTVPQIVTQDPSSRFHMFDGFPKLYERAAAKLAESQANSQPEPLIIRPSAQWYASGEEDSCVESQKKLRFNEAVRDQFGVWHVCYSMHSSREELEWALQLLAPKWVVSTTPSCWAMELDYVKKCSTGTQLTSDDPVWKLLDITVEAPPAADTSTRTMGPSPIVKRPTQIYAESRSQSVKVSSSRLLSLSPPSNRPAVTLFGRARLAIKDSNLPSEEQVLSINNQPPLALAVEEDSEVKNENKLENKLEICVTEEQCQESVKEQKTASYSSIGSSRNFSETLKNLYRSMNVPVPRPLPSLVELRGAYKRNKRRIEF